jgi:predicted flap endonuclease-1-like 5' DNA nuclease
MPDITVIHIALLAGTLIVGLLLGWVIRGSRSVAEKKAISAGWQEQLEAQRTEHQRLLEQNKSLMQQNSQYQASNKDSKMRASELSDALKETFERRDEMQRQLKDIRSNLEVAVAERKQLQGDLDALYADADAAAAEVKQRDETIEKLSRELQGWQDRVPPLIEKFRLRNEEAEQLDAQLACAHDRIEALESMLGSDETRIEPVDPAAMQDGLDASNDPNESTQPHNDSDDGYPEIAPTDTDDEDEEDDDLDELLGSGEFANLIDEDIPDQPDEAVPERVEAVNGSDDSEHFAHDDLKLIKGVGPAIEKTLNELGISRFSQIAEMGEYDIDRVANKLKGFRSRIYREDWIGQARDLHDQKVAS